MLTPTQVNRVWNGGGGVLFKDPQGRAARMCKAPSASGSGIGACEDAQVPTGKTSRGDSSLSANQLGQAGAAGAPQEILQAGASRGLKLPRSSATGSISVVEHDTFPSKRGPGRPKRTAEVLAGAACFIRFQANRAWHLTLRLSRRRWRARRPPAQTLRRQAQNG
jgi:hypothetical protein